MKKKVLATLMAAIMLMGLLAGCGAKEEPAASAGSAGAGSAAAAAPTYEWKMALNSTEGDNAYDTGALFAQKVEELTGGQVKVTLYGGASLGSTAEVLEGMSVGVADVMVESVGTLATFTPLANIEAMPYMFNSYDHFMEVWYSDLGEEIKTAVGDAAGFKLMGAAYRGPRIVTATKEMKTVEDFKGFKLRAPNLEMYIKTWQW
ncbi:MAG: TRAP transporter substrate-binding protein DctP, partial [Oscillibacter sp.]|nr:TRAP transporter substrate-binding protein DctP [Oscillibacter sp.]